MQTNIVEVEHLSHKYAKDWAIRDINFKIDQNGIVGLLGSNGAGKSTTMNIMCGVLNQTEGKVYIDGVDLSKDPLGAKRLIGFLPQNAPLHLDLTVDEYLTYCAQLRLISRKKIQPAVGEAKERCGVTHFSKRLIRNLSGGYRQRVGIAQAILHSPRLVVLDEPTNGLDPNQILEVRKLIREVGQERSVIFSSHILSEIQATCQYIKMIEHGVMVFEDTAEAFNNYIDPDSMLVAMDNPPAPEVLKSIEGITRVEPLHGKYLRLQFEGSPAISGRIVQMSVENNWHLTEVTLEKSSLDAIFAQLSNKRKS
jgi:ABC-2 type transport system ATP-binding protein